MNGERFAMFNSDGLNLCIINGYFDHNHESEVTKKAITMQFMMI